MPLAPRPAAQLAAPSRPGFVAGSRALLGGFGFVLGTPSVWPLALVPVVIGAGLTAVIGFGAVHFVPGWIAGAIGATTTAGRVAAMLLEIAATALGLAAALVFGFGLAQPLSGPALAGLVRRQRVALGAPSPPEIAFWTDVGRSLQSVLLGLAVGAPILALLFLLSWLFPPAVIVTVPLKLLVMAALLAWDLCDYPLSIAGFPIARRLAFFRRNLGAVIGFGFTLAVLALVPCALLLVLPAGVAGAARLTLAIERLEPSDDRRRAR